MFYNDRMNDSYLYCNKQLIKPKGLFKVNYFQSSPMSDRPANSELDIFFDRTAVHSQSDPAELDNLLAGGTDEK